MTDYYKASVYTYVPDMEAQPRSGDGGGAPWGPPPPAPAEATSRAAGPGRRPTTHTHQQQQQAVKVKHIVTREVSTTVASFKDVVQSLTGKDSAAARAAVVAAGDDGTSRWSGGAAVVAVRGATTTSTAGVPTSGAVVFEDNVAGAGATMVFPSEVDTRRFWRG